MTPRLAAVLALLFSGLAALLYQLVWTRLLGFAFGTTSEAIGSVLAVFFGGLALGNALAARLAHRLTRPLRTYAWLELAIGLLALASLPALQALPGLAAWLGPDVSPATWLTVRLVVAALILLPPTIAMGATLPVIAHGVVAHDETRGRWSGILYAANTFGAVAGAYLCGFVLIPALGLTQTLLVAAAANLLVALAILRVAGDAPAAWKAAAAEAPVAAGAASPPADLQRSSEAASGSQPSSGPFLLFFAISGFVAIGYEIVWSKLFGIVMEGTLYGFATVLAAYLFGIGAGSFAIAPFVDRVRAPVRLFGLLHVGIGVSVAAGIALVPWLPGLRASLLAGAVDPVHGLFLVAAPVVLVPAALFGAAFPVLIRIHARRASDVGAGMGRAVACNTAGSIAASLLVGFVFVPRFGMDATLFGLLLLDLAVALIVLLGYQEGAPRVRLPAFATGAAALVLVSLSYGGVSVDRTIAARQAALVSTEGFVARVEAELAQQILLREGRNSVVTVTETDAGRSLRTNGLPEAGTMLSPPYMPSTTFLLGVVPYLLAAHPERALVVGLGGGNTVKALLETPIPRIETVELERAVVEAAPLLHEGRADPTANPRVQVIVNDGRNELLRRSRAPGPRPDVIASQPSHPWIVGAANLFTQDYFELARENLATGGVFAVWLNGFRTDALSVLSVMASFAEVFPDGLVMDVSVHRDRRALLLLGREGGGPIDLDEMRRRMAEPGLSEALALYDLADAEALLQRIEGPVLAFGELADGVRNTDDNAFVETRVPRQRQETWNQLDFAELELRLPAGTPLLPALVGELDYGRLARALAAAGQGPKLDRLLRDPRFTLDPVSTRMLRAQAALQHEELAPQALDVLDALAEAHPDRADIQRVLGLYRAGELRDFEAAASHFERAFELTGSSQDAFDAARSLDHVDPEAALAHVARIPEADRAEFPRLALFEARRALREGRTGPGLGPLLAELDRFRMSDEGRALPGVALVQSELARAAGDVRGAAGLREIDRAERARSAEPYAQRARFALAEGRLAEAGAALRHAAGLMPGDAELARLGARLAAARGDVAAAERALRVVAAAAPSPGAAVGIENRLRRELGLPLLPPVSAELLAR